MLLAKLHDPNGGDPVEVEPSLNWRYDWPDSTHFAFEAQRDDSVLSVDAISVDVTTGNEPS